MELGQLNLRVSKVVKILFAENNSLLANRALHDWPSQALVELHKRDPEAYREVIGRFGVGGPLSHLNTPEGYLKDRLETSIAQSF